MAKIPLEFLRSVACVWVNGKVAGTGFIISPGVMLTCAHVVQLKSKQLAKEQIRLEFLADLYARLDSQNAALPGDTESKSFQFRVQNSQKSWPISKVCHFDPTLDVALLTFEAPVSENVVPARVSFRTSLRDLKVQTFGFALRDDPREHLGPNTLPKKGGRKKSVPSGSDSDAEETVARLVHGRFATAKLQIPVPAPESSQYFQLASFGQIEPGFSGAPICDIASGQVIGMIRCCDVDGAAAHAFCIPLHQIRDRVDVVKQLYSRFLEATIRTLMTQNGANLQRSINETLAKNPRAVSLITAELKCPGPSSAANLSEHLCRVLDPHGEDAHVRETAVALGRLYRKITSIRDPDMDTINCLVSLYMAYAPYKILHRAQDDLSQLCSKLQGNHDRRVDLRCQEELVEVYMAALDGRPAEYEYEPEKQVLKGRYQLDSLPEWGITMNDGHTLPVSAFCKSVAQKVGYGLDLTLSPEMQLTKLNSFLEYLHDTGETRYMAIVDSTLAAKKLSDDHVAEFCRLFRAIAVVHLETSKETKFEQSLVHPFQAGHLLNKPKQ
jgi:hypothetical protein